MIDNYSSAIEAAFVVETTVKRYRRGIFFKLKILLERRRSLLFLEHLLGNLSLRDNNLVAAVQLG